MAVHIGFLLVAVAANSFSAVADFLRLDRIRVGMERVGVAEVGSAVVRGGGRERVRARHRMIGLPLGFLAPAVTAVVTAPV